MGRKMLFLRGLVEVHEILYYYFLIVKIKDGSFEKIKKYTNFNLNYYFHILKTLMLVKNKKSKKITEF